MMWNYFSSSGLAKCRKDAALGPIIPALVYRCGKKCWFPAQSIRLLVNRDDRSTAAVTLWLLVVAMTS